MPSQQQKQIQNEEEELPLLGNEDDNVEEQKQELISEISSQSDGISSLPEDVVNDISDDRKRKYYRLSSRFMFITWSNIQRDSCDLDDIFEKLKDKCQTKEESRKLMSPVFIFGVAR